MQPAGRRDVVDLALQGGAMASRQWRPRAEGAVAAAARRQRVPASDPRRPRSACCCCSAASSSRWSSARCRRCSTFGFGFLVSERWNPVTEKFGALAPIYGTIVTSLIAMLIAVPIGLMIAMFLTELCPQWLRRPIGIAIELLAGIPSIIYGIWGLFVFAPFLQDTLQPFLIALFGECPGAVHAVRRPALRHRHADRGPDPGDHGAAVHHLDLARRVRGGAAGAQGSRLRPRLHHLGGGALRRAALHAGRRASAASCSGSAARSARPWR